MVGLANARPTLHPMSKPAWQNSLIMRAARREPVERTPVWLMRQAGRYQADYRRLREKTSFLELCKTPDLAAEVMLSTVERLGVDAAIIFSDLLLILEPMGLSLDFAADEGPRLGNPIREPADVDRLLELESIESLEFVIETVRKTRAGLDPALPLIGFAGAPFTLAAYSIEGGASRDYRIAKKLMLSDAGAWDAMMARLARAVTLYLNAQIDAGAQLAQIFDSWAGCLGPDDYRRHVLPHTRSVIEGLRPGVPAIHFAVGNPALLPLLSEAFSQSDRPAIVGVDWRVRLDDAWTAIGPNRAIQGNLDPVVLLTDPPTIRRRAKEILDQAAGRSGHIFNLGHGILPQTPPENVVALVEAVHELNSKVRTRRKID
ncbi:MAG: uroporphyrinogen decarboxylase [Pirellulales bacterium]|nr:uroporphyrinogen decarboxylase [Pirellulales bacterium]